MTGLAFSLAIWMARFCTSGTSSSGSSTPRSPRATMIASNASTMASRLSMASGFSSLAMTGTRRPTRSITSWTSSISAGERTNDSATRSTPSRSANSRSSMSFSDSAGTDTFMPGSDMPLLLLTGPPSVTVHTTSLPSMCLDDQADVAVVDQQPVAGRGILGQLLVGGRHPVVGALAVVDRDPHGFAVGPERGTGGEPAEPDLGALQVGEDADRMPGHIGGCADALVGGLVVGVVAVAEVEPRDVHPGLDQCPDRLVGCGGRAERTDDLSASSHDF